MGQFVQAENQVRKQELSDFEVELTGKRDVLTQIKHERDSLRAENAARRQQRGLVSSEELLLDYERRRQALISTGDQVKQLQQKHAFLLKSVADAKRRITA